MLLRSLKVTELYIQNSAMMMNCLDVLFVCLLVLVQGLERGSKVTRYALICLIVLYPFLKGSRNELMSLHVMYDLPKGLGKRSENTVNEG